jgi:hypothetical protein
MRFLFALDAAELWVAALAIDVGVRAPAPVAHVVGARVAVVTVGIAAAFLAAVDAAQLIVFAVGKVAGPHLAIAGEAGVWAHTVTGIAALLRFIAAGRCADLTHRTQRRLGCVGALALDASVEGAGDIVVTFVTHAALAAACRRSSQSRTALLLGSTQC